MKTVSNFRDLEQFGIYPLTGEADNLSFRMLCDVDYRGYKVLCETWGFPKTWTPDSGPKTPVGWADNWNLGYDDHKHIASVMLSQNMIEPIAIIGLLTVGNCHTVITTEPAPKWNSPGVIGLHSSESYTSAPYDFEKGEYTGPAMVNLEHFGEREWPECYGKVLRVFRSSGHPHSGTRNVHAMSGRTE